MASRYTITAALRLRLAADLAQDVETDPLVAFDAQDKQELARARTILRRAARRLETQPDSEEKSDD